MNVDIQCGPAYAVAYCILDAGEEVLVERGAMIAMSGNVDVAAGMGSGGLAGALMRKAVGGESFFMGRYTAAMSGAWVAVASGKPGDIARITLEGGDGVVIEAGAMLAASSGVRVDPRVSGLGNIILREGAMMLHASGVGDLLVSAFGGIQRFDLGPSDSIIVDTGHVVGFSRSCKLRVGPLAGVVTSGVTGEGLVGLFAGPGTVWMQTRAEGAFRSWLFPDSAR